MSQPIIAFVGSCSVDFTTYAARLPRQGETITGDKFVTSYGGKGANQCVAAAKLGSRVYLIAKLGDDDWGHKYKEYLTKLGVDTTYTTLCRNCATGTAHICVSRDGHNQIVVVGGANAQLGSGEVRDAARVVADADVIVAQLETPIRATAEAFKLNSGIRILNAAPVRDDIAELLPLCSVLCVNESEAELLARLPVNDVESGVKALQELQNFGCEIVIITLGGDGALYATREEPAVVHVPCAAVVPVDTTGAGDAFVGALATFLAIHRDKPLHQIIGAACSVATVSVTREGTQTSYPTECQVFHKQYPYRVVG